MGSVDIGNGGMGGLLKHGVIFMPASNLTMLIKRKITCKQFSDLLQMCKMYLQENMLQGVDFH